MTCEYSEIIKQAKRDAVQKVFDKMPDFQKKKFIKTFSFTPQVLSEGQCRYCFYWCKDVLKRYRERTNLC